MLKRTFLILCTMLPIVSCAQELPTGDWMELPAYSDDAEVHSLQMTVDGKMQRNYSFKWDEEHLTADWVAYPLCRGNIGEGTRSNAFGLNPYMPKDRQPALYRGYREGDCGRYSRGHQIPSADRLQYKANVTTFYGTNMTPQDENLNGGVWGSLENKVRAWALKCDTLYVVTGCTYDGYKGGYALDNDGRHVAVPTGYYKALLRLSAGEWHACAFQYDNRPYGSGKFDFSAALPLAELEERTGLEFFPRLRDVVGDERYRRIKAESPWRSGVWK